MLGRRDPAILLEGLGPGGYEDDLIEGEDVLDLTGCHEVPMVDRIKGSSHDTDAKRTSRLGHALRLASFLGDTLALLNRFGQLQLANILGEPVRPAPMSSETPEPTEPVESVESSTMPAV